MSEGLFDDVPLMNKERDASWEAFIKRKDVKAMFSEEGFGFPLNRGYYDLWCIAWAKAWDKGFMAEREKNDHDKDAEIKRLNEKIEFLARTNMLYSDWEHRETQVTSDLIRKGIEEAKINAELRAEIERLKEVSWGVDWGKAGDTPCATIVRRLLNGGIEVLAVEYAPYTLKEKNT